MAIYLVFNNNNVGQQCHLLEHGSKNLQDFSEQAKEKDQIHGLSQLWIAPLFKNYTSKSLINNQTDIEPAICHVLS